MDVFGGADSAHGMTLDARIGGSPLNVAIGLARLAQPVAFFGAVSTGFLGQRLHARAARRRRGHRLPCRGWTRPPRWGWSGWTRVGVPSYSFYGHGCADRLLAAGGAGHGAGRGTRLPLRLFRDGGGAGGGHAARAGRTRTSALPDRLRPEHPPERRARHSALARYAAVDAAAHPPAEGQRGGPGPALSGPRAGRHWRATWLASGVPGSWSPTAPTAPAPGGGEQLRVEPVPVHGGRHGRRGRHLPGGAAHRPGRARALSRESLRDMAGSAVMRRCWSLPRAQPPSPARAAARTCRGAPNSTDQRLSRPGPANAFRRRWPRSPGTCCTCPGRAGAGRACRRRS